MKKIAIIPARGGSKRIPRKNIKQFLGKPLIAYSIEVAKQSGLFDEIMVSTDDVEIANVAKDCGANVPFMRNEATSNDQAAITDVLKEVIEKYRSMGQHFDQCCCIYATAPFVSVEHLSMGLETLNNSGCRAVLPIVAYDYPIQRSMNLDDSGKISWTDPSNALKRSQDLEPRYHDAGQFFWFDVDNFIEIGTVISDETAGIVLDKMVVQDIDTESDWNIAEFKYSYLKKNQADN